MKWVAAGLCAYEVGAIATGRVPTLTRLSQQHRWLGPALVLSLAAHLYRQPRMRSDRDCLLCLNPMGDEP